MKRTILILAGILIVIVGGYFYFQQRGGSSSSSSSSGGGLLSANRNVQITKDFTGAKIDQDELSRGCPRRDCIPSIDNPEFESVAEADEWLNDGDRIFGIVHNGVARAYAQRILNWHEIVNDTIDGDPIAMTFCPLCGTAVSFVREVNGEVAEFGVSGFLHNSDLVMYDRIEGNLWQQITAEAIVGPAAQRDEELALLNTITTDWEDWKASYPDSEVLSIPGGFVRDYSRYPYGTYEENGEIYFGIENEDDRLHPKEVVYGIVINGEAKAYPLETLEIQGTVEDQLGGRSITGTFSADGEVIFVDKESGEEYIPLRGFWFAWAAFNPETEIFN